MKKELDPKRSTIEDFPKLDLHVADLLNFLDKKEILMICDMDSNSLYHGRAEDLMWTEEGFMHELGFRKINWFERGTSEIIIYVEPEEVKPINI